MKINPLTKKELKILQKLLLNICSLDNKMKDIALLTHKRQVILFKDEYRFELLCKIEEFFKAQQVPCRTLRGCVTIQLQNCTVRIYRNYI